MASHESYDTRSKQRVPAFLHNATHYPKWRKTRMQEFIRNDVEDLITKEGSVEPELVKGEESDAAVVLAHKTALRAWRKSNAVAWNIIAVSMNDKMYQSVYNATTAYQLWVDIERDCRPKGLAEKVKTLNMVHTINAKQFNTVNEYCNAFKSRYEDLVLDWSGEEFGPHCTTRFAAVCLFINGLAVREEFVPYVSGVTSGTATAVKKLTDLDLDEIMDGARNYGNTIVQARATPAGKQSATAMHADSGKGRGNSNRGGRGEGQSGRRGGNAGSSKSQGQPNRPSDWTEKGQCYVHPEAPHHNNQCWVQFPDKRPKNNNNNGDGKPLAAFTYGNDGYSFAVTSSSSSSFSVPSPLPPSYGGKDSWLIDTASDIHICNKFSLFTSLHDSDPVTVNGMGKGPATVTKKGTVALTLQLPNQQTQLLKLHNVHYLASAPVNLISTALLRDLGGIYFSTRDDQLRLVNDDRLVGVAPRKGGHNVLSLHGKHQLPPPFNDGNNHAALYTRSKPDYDLIHKRFGHSGLSLLQDLKKHSSLDVEFPESSPCLCDVCELSKSTRVVSRGPIVREQQPFADLAYDVFGPITPSPPDCRFGLVRVDGYCSLRTFMPMLHKGEAFAHIVNDVASITRHFPDWPVRAIHIDGGKEFGGQQLVGYCAQNGIDLIVSAFYTPEQNGLAESAVKVIKQRTRNLMIDSGLPAAMWPFAASHAAYLSGILPTSRSSIPPWTRLERARGNVEFKLSVDHIRRFGCLAYVNIPVPRRDRLQGSFAPRAVRGYLLGMQGALGTTNYKVWIPETSRFIITPHVTFNEERVYRDSFKPNRHLEEVAAWIDDAIADGSTFPGLPEAHSGPLQPGQPEEPLQDSGFDEPDVYIDDVLPQDGYDNHPSEGAPTDAEDGAQPSEGAAVDVVDVEAESQSPATVTIEDDPIQDQIEVDIGVENSHSTDLQDTVTSSRDTSPRQVSAPSDLPTASEGAPRTPREAPGEDPGATSPPQPPAGGRTLRNRTRQDYVELATGRPRRCTTAPRGAAASRGEPASRSRGSRARGANAVLSAAVTSPPAPAVAKHIDPSTWNEAMRSPQAAQWRAARDKEIKQLLDLRVFEFCNTIPNGHRPIDGKLIFKTKYLPDGTIDKFKARYVAKGFQQRELIDYYDTYAATLRPCSFRLFTALVAHWDLKVHQIDVVGAFLHSKLDVPLYMRAPPGSEAQGPFVKILKSLYGLKQAPLLWYKALSESLKSFGFDPILTDICCFRNKAATVWVVAYVDDLQVAGFDDLAVKTLIDGLSKVFELQVRPNDTYLGVQIERTKHQILLHQAPYIDDVLERFGMADCKAAKTPGTLIPLEPYSGTAAAKELQEYQSLTGSLIFLPSHTRPDIAHRVNELCRYNSNPGPEHFVAGKHVLRYLQGSKRLGVIYPVKPGLGKQDPVLTAYSDSDYAGDHATRRSTGAFVFTLNGGPIAWSSRLQSTVALSSTEAEYAALTECCREAMWMTQHIELLGLAPKFKPLLPLLIHEDNQSTIALATNHVNYKRVKHVDVRNHYCRDLYSQGKIAIEYVSTELQAADGLTKSFGAHKWHTMLQQLNMVPNGAASS